MNDLNFTLVREVFHDFFALDFSPHERALTERAMKR